MSNVEKRLQRLLAIVPWIVERDGPTLAEVAERFELSEKQLVKELEGVLWLCGIPPYSPADLVEVDIVDGRVWIRVAPYFSRPLRLTPAEALGLLGAARIAMAGKDSGPTLARAVAKLSAALGIDADEILEIEMVEPDNAVLDALESAAALHQVVGLRYYSYGRDAWEQRDVEPHRVFNSKGAWYAWAWCRKVNDWRLFRVDRARTADPTGEQFEPREVPPVPDLLGPARSEARVVLEVAPEARWATQEYPVESVRAGSDGWLQVAFGVAERAWLERLLLRLGPDARIVEGDPEVGPEAARRVLARYR